MEKFSLYDFLGLLLPGVLFIFFISLILNLIGIDINLFSTSEWMLDLGLSLSLVIILGAIFYAGNFYLIKRHWYSKVFGMYKDVSLLLMECKDVYEMISPTINAKAKDWYGRDIFPLPEKQTVADKKNTAELDKLRDSFYDRMYYELEYHEKIENPKTMQSFYFFFRQSALACTILMLIIAVLTLLALLKLYGLAGMTQNLLGAKSPACCISGNVRFYLSHSAMHCGDCVR
jgi:hypothetical protein